MQRRRLRITGTVQGVGFRPHLHRLATDLGVSGVAGNDDVGVWCEVQGTTTQLDEFADRLVADAPALAQIDDVAVGSVESVDGEQGFRLAASVSTGNVARATVPADVAPCGRCLAELADPTDRRFRYPFICCTDCGPRYTVVDALPYDRGRTSMAEFELCQLCAAEYADPIDRRYHAQANCCADCGPTLSLTAGGVAVPGDPIEETVARLQRGAIVAVKGVGGYQLVCLADDEDAVARLRHRKQREEKPFALLVESVDQASALVELDRRAVDALIGRHAPIVLAPRRPTSPVAEAVAPDTGLLGLMLPASPMHALLIEGVGRPLVCTSGNRSDEPIVIDDRDVDHSLGPICDAVLGHDRRIARRADDSIGHVMAGRFQVLRRARGLAAPVSLPGPGPTVL
ncbi:MAG: Sua5/YciO/YrdC/YwlC family protein, partial [Acidimicrobiales bacterium]